MQKRSVFVSIAVSTVLCAPFLRALPAAAQPADFSGLYFPSRGRTVSPQPPEYTPAAKAALAEYQAAFETDDDPGRYCIWPGIPRAIWGAQFAVEIQQRPQDLTVYWEGYGMYRKIYMADHDPPTPLLPSAMGHSVAHWEGATLVIETTHLRHYPYMNRMATSSDAHVVERMRVEEREVDGQKNKFIVNELVLTDPKVYTTPVKITATLAQRRDAQLLEYTCSDTLWDEYLSVRGLALPDIDGFPEPRGVEP
jgi:hypothetical protein